MAIWGIRIGLLAIWLAIALFLTQSLFIGDSTTEGQVILMVAAALGGSIIATLLTIVTGKVSRGSYRKRRMPLAQIAIRVIDAASRRTGLPIPARGIADREGSLAISLEVPQPEFLAVGDQIYATNTVTGEQLGTLEVVVVEQDYCLCEVTDRMDSSDFWTGLEERMTRCFCPPSRVEFGQYVSENSIDSVSRLVRRWGG